MISSARANDAGQLAAMLRAHASGSYAAGAAAELVIRHDVWLDRDDFVHDHVRIGRTPWNAAADGWAWVDWESAVAALDAGALPCSGSEGRILRIAASIGGGVLIDLSTCLTSLDGTNVARVVNAIQHANGRSDVWAAHGSEASEPRHRERRPADDDR